MAEEQDFQSLVYTPTWVVALVCSIIVLISLLAERGLHRLGKCLKHKNQDKLYEALQKLKEELMLLGFISLLLTVSQTSISRICIPAHVASTMLPCKKSTASESLPGVEHELYSFQGLKNRRLLSSSADHCSPQGKVQLLSLEALHQLHIFIFVLAVVHVIFCATTMVLGGAKIKLWKHWENSIRAELLKPGNGNTKPHHHHRLHHEMFKKRAVGYWRKSDILSWTMSFFKQFYGSVTKSDYIVLRQGFIMTHCRSNPRFDFHKYMTRTLAYDFKKIVGISWYLWLFVVVFLLLNVEGWHTYFWLAFLPLTLLLLVGAKLEHVIYRLAQDIADRHVDDYEGQGVKPSDEYFWFGRPTIVLYLIHFILFQNSFEIAFFFWILSTYGFHSCIMEKLGYIVPRLIMGLIVQVLCSYSTLPLYVLVTQMGSMFKQGIFDEHVHEYIQDWAHDIRWKGESSRTAKEHKLTKQSSQDDIIVADDYPL